MALLQWALTCRDVSVDNQNNITYRDAIEVIKAEEFPVDLPPAIKVCMLWRREDLSEGETSQYRLVLEDDEENELAEMDSIEVDLRDHERVRSNNINPPITIEEPTTIWFGIEKRSSDDDNWERVWTLPVELREIEAEVDREEPKRLA
jgi:hypothetical protein